MTEELGPLTVEELKLLAERERGAARKRRLRAEQAAERAEVAGVPNPTGYQTPPMPAGLSAIRGWVRKSHDAYSQRRLGTVEPAEIRRSAAAVGDLYKVGAELRKAQAALRAAEAQERMADALAAVEHGGAAVMLLARLQESLQDGGKRRPLPGRLIAAPRPESDPAA